MYNSVYSENQKNKNIILKKYTYICPYCINNVNFSNHYAHIKTKYCNKLKNEYLIINNKSMIIEKDRKIIKIRKYIVNNLNNIDLINEFIDDLS